MGKKYPNPSLARLNIEYKWIMFFKNSVRIVCKNSIFRGKEVRTKVTHPLPLNSPTINIKGEVTFPFVL